MAKGENLEKPNKKGGMVIVIGVGKPTKPKKGDLKKSGPRRRGGGAASNRSRKVQMKERMEEDPNYLQQQFERFNVNEDFMNKYFEHHHGKSLDEAIDDDSINIIESMKQARRMKAANEGHDPKNAGLRRLLNDRGISFSQLRQSLDDDPFMEWRDRIDSLTDNDHVEDQRNRSRGGGRGFTPTREERPSSRNNEREDGPQNRRAQLRNMGLGEFQINDQLEHDRLVEQDEAYRRRNRLTPAPKRELDDMDVERIARLLSARYPQDVAEEMAARYVQQGFHFNPSEHEFNVSMQNRDDDEDPMVGFSAASIGAETPKSQTANPRELGPLMRPREGQGEDKIIRPFQMQTSFDNPLNVMDAAWALLKGNPSMRDAEGRAINHPAAMVYDDLAAQIHLNEQNPFDERLGNPDDESAADVMEQMRQPTHQRKLMSRMKQGKPVSFLDAKMATRNDEAEKKRLRQHRQEAREQTRNTMEFGDLDDSPSPNYGIQQSTGTDVRMKPGNIMEQM